MDAQTLLRTAFSTFGDVAPDTMAALAERFFTRPRRIPAPPRERPWIDEAEAAVVDTPVGPVQTLSWSKRLFPWERDADVSPRGTVLLVHGWEGRGSQLCAFVGPLLERGFRAVAFDGPAHGKSPGAAADALLFSLALRAVAGAQGAADGKVRSVIAHSMGAGAATVAVADGLVVDSVVLLAPPLSADTVTDDFARGLGLTPSTTRALKERLARRFHAYAWHRLSFAQAARDGAAQRRAVPCLIVHDHDDVEIPFARGASLVARWPGAVLKETHGFGHRKILRDAAVVDDAVSFVDATARAGGAGDAD